MYTLIDRDNFNLRQGKLFSQIPTPIKFSDNNKSNTILIG